MRRRPSPSASAPEAGRAVAPSPLLAGLSLLLAGLQACGPSPDRSSGEAASASRDAGNGEPVQEVRTVPAEEGEAHLENLRMLTHRGQNAEAYFSPDERKLIFQATIPGVTECDQIFVMDVDGTDRRMVSTGRGRTTCGYFLPGGERILYSSTHHLGPECPPEPDRSRGYVWALYDYDIYTARADGSDVELLFRSPGYDAEATVSPEGDRIVFTSTRDGDLELYTMKLDGSDVKRLTHEVGYDGGAFYGPKGEKIVYRAQHPETEEEVAEYRSLLEDGLVRPTPIDVYVMDADGSDKRRLTDNGADNFAPYFHPDGDRIIFSSNMREPGSGKFDLYMIGVDGTGLERITTHPDFDAFPMFRSDGEKLVFGSNRHGDEPHDTNVFLADWVEEP